MKLSNYIVKNLGNTKKFPGYKSGIRYRYQVHALVKFNLLIVSSALCILFALFRLIFSSFAQLFTHIL